VQKKFEFKIDETYVRNRLDQLLFDKIGDLSKMRLRDYLKEEQCFVNNKPKDCGYKLELNDLVEIEVDINEQTSMKPEDIPLDIVFEDGEVLVVNKPTEMIVHPTLKYRLGTLMNALSFHLNCTDGVANKAFIRPGLVHRLDRQTSGLLVIAKNPRAHRILCDHFQRKLIAKKYVAVVEGNVADETGTIDARIGRYDDIKHWDVKSDGKSAETRWTVLNRFDNKTLLELIPITGRTNQLRIHCNHIGHPILGDVWYGKESYKRLCLHAKSLSFHHPNGDNWLEFDTEIPNDFANQNAEQ
jgi:23S rRNA pseudouridine1911/1915/1917 synthase